MCLHFSFVVAAVTAIPSGIWLDRLGARAPMILGAFGSSVLLVCWASVTQYWQFVAGWVCLGVCMGLVLTQSAYAAYVQLLGPRSKEAITLTALATGLSSTVFIPLGFFLIEKFGWRHALL